ncbi:hypothetical protein [Natrarchaeobius oligotrophus]|uniref:CARDB domain-containing protein n=1 Tax=Natrarchaeobius chitinivorans TaxID=1679083 RepID=A0A3N6M5N8_NATCH|nr:hypothetical protein [Natrarchaeobius chitinivorans]RQG97407.1 hypothetical protein EA472_19455 [Natrarchaeobius chitinivorans]
MGRPTRRRLLRGVSTGSVVLALDRRRGRGDRVSDPLGRRRSADSPLEVRIEETNAPVAAGEYLDVTVSIENAGSTPVRTHVDFLVGSDVEPVSRIGTTIDAGETRSGLGMGFHTYPVPTDDEFPIRIEVEGASAERTISVAGATTYESVRPDPRVSVRPETEVLFEVDAVDPDDGQTTIWWVDGERVGDTLADPWQSTYFLETGAHYLRRSFDEPGSHEVTAAVLPDGEPGSYAARWTVDVAPAGSPAPTIEALRPAEEVISVGSDEEVTFELEAAHPNGLDRVVWWLTQADSVLGVTGLAGERDVARLSTGGCHTCRLVPWVICEDGPMATPEPTWQFETVRDESISLSIRETISPVAAGDRLEVTADVENAGSTTATRNLELVVGHDPTVVDERTVSLDPGETTAVTLAFETYPTSQDERFPARIVTADAADEVTVRVSA